MYKKIIATDMDGTFLRSDHGFDPTRFRNLLEAFKEKGYLFVAASGRSLPSLKHLFEEFLEDIALVAENGAVVVYRNQTIYLDDPIQPATYLSLVEELVQSGHVAAQHVTLSGLTASYMLKAVDTGLYDILSDYYHDIVLVPSFEDISEEIIKLNLYIDEAIRVEAQDWINHHFKQLTAVTTGFTSIDIILSGVHKGIGLSHLCQHLGLTGENLIAFGDNQNDLEMLKLAACSVATENAIDEVRAQADLVIGHCNDEAVMAYMEELVNGN
ncbi:TPA: HAD family hydrolase [Streptococcus suis]|nr:HAD family hydrolase [Streptococcus suis]